MKVFLGGTCNESDWRDRLIQLLVIDYFNPIVDNWTSEAYAKEIEERQKCDYCLYVITPKMTGVYSIAEAVDDSNKKPDKTIFCILEQDGDKTFDYGQMLSLDRVGLMIQKNGGKVFHNLIDVATFLNGEKDV